MQKNGKKTITSDGIEPIKARGPGRPALGDHVIRVGGAIALLPLLHAKGIDADALAEEAGLPVAAFDDADNVVPFVALGRFAQLAARRTSLPDIGLRAGREAGSRSLGVVGYLVANSETVGSAIASLETYLHLHDQGAVPFLAQENGTATLGYEILKPGVDGADQLTFGALAIGTNILRELCGEEFRLRQVTFAYQAPPDTSSFRHFFAAPVRFDAPRNALYFDAHWLTRPIHGADAKLRDLLLSQVRQRSDAAAGGVTRDRVQRVVRTLLIAGRCGERDVALAFGIKQRTLARRLQDAGTTFRELVDQARYDAARLLLRNTMVSIAEVASRLGYADASAFTRAFRRWSGTAPALWRRGSPGTSARRPPASQPERQRKNSATRIA